MSFKELLNHVCSRPGMWVPGGTFHEVYSLIMGYTIGKKDTPLSEGNWNIFNSHVCQKFGFPGNYTASHVIERCTNNDEEAIKLFEETVNEFVDKSK